MSSVKAGVGIVKKGRVVLEDPSLFNSDEFVIVISGDSFSQYIDKLTGKFKERIIRSKEFTDAEHP